MPSAKFNATFLSVSIIIPFAKDILTPVEVEVIGPTGSTFTSMPSAVTWIPLVDFTANLSKSVPVNCKPGTSAKSTSIIVVDLSILIDENAPSAIVVYI